MFLCCCETTMQFLHWHSHLTLNLLLVQILVHLPLLHLIRITFYSHSPMLKILHTHSKDLLNIM